MFNTIYIEEQVADHLRTREICARYPQAAQVPCNRYGEVFNRKNQDFRLQKQKPALILAHKHAGRVLEAPEGYGIGGSSNYYFSHMLNCLYDCRYCFLQGMYRSAHYVVFVNYEDFESDMEQLLDGNSEHWFFSGYDCDSLALEPVTGFIKHFLPFFAAHPAAKLEIRTKSTQVRNLLATQPLANAVIAFSFTPEEIHHTLEHKVPALDKRLEAIAKLQQAGWSTGLRFDPLIYTPDYREQYRRLFRQVFEKIDAGQLHSVSFGPFRLPRSFFRNIVKLYPYEPLFAGRFCETDGRELEQELTGFCSTELLEYIPESLLFPCQVAA